MHVTSEGYPHGKPRGDYVKPPTALIAELAAGLASDLRAIFVPPDRVKAAGTDLHVRMDGRDYAFAVGSDLWPRDASLAANVEADVEITLGAIQSELAEVTTEPWPGRSAAKPADATTPLPEFEATLTGETLNLLLRWGSAVTEFPAIRLKVDH